MHVVVIIQARMTSTRLPSKIMLPLGDKTVLGQVLTRCKKIKGVDEICCAIPIGKEHDILIDEIKKYQCTVLGVQKVMCWKGTTRQRKLQKQILL